MKLPCHVQCGFNGEEAGKSEKSEEHNFVHSVSFMKSVSKTLSEISQIAVRASFYHHFIELDEEKIYQYYVINTLINRK